jgi:hypothetical protein
MPICSIDGCDNEAKYVKTGWCQTHYHRWYRTGVIGLQPKDWWSPITYRSAHTRVTSVFGVAKDHLCICCGGSAKEWSYDGTDPTELSEDVKVADEYFPVRYSLFPEFYAPKCFPCHRLGDAGARALRRTHCTYDHALTPENTYIPPGGRKRECKTCRRKNSREQQMAKRAALKARGLTSRGTPLKRGVVENDAENKNE